MLGSPPSMRAPRPAADRVARVVFVISSTWYAFTAVWGMFGIPGGGHYGAGSAADAMISEPIVRWKILYPAWDWYTGVPPTPAQYVCHHPFGMNYISAFCLWVFGHRDFVVHLPAVVLSSFIPPLLYGIAKERWGKPVGAVAAAAYVVVPIAVGFSGFWALETPCIFGALLFFWGHSRQMATGKDRYMVASLLGLGCACMGDWAGYLIVLPTLGWAMLRAFVLPAGLTPSLRFAPYARWWALSVAVACATLLFSIGLFFKANHVSDWLSAGDTRSAGHEGRLEDVLEARAHWIDFSFTPIAIFVGKLAAPVCVLRWIATRRDEETYSLGFLFAGVIQYVVFKEGADVHIFWPHYFAAYFALSLAELAATTASVAGWIAKRLAHAAPVSVGAAAGLVVGLLPTLAMAHDGVLSLWVWRRTGGRYDDNGTLIRSHIDMISVVEQVMVPRMLLDGHVDANVSATWGWEHMWKTQATSTTVELPSAGVSGVDGYPHFFVARGSALSSAEAARRSPRSPTFAPTGTRGSSTSVNPPPRSTPTP